MSKLAAAGIETHSLDVCDEQSIKEALQWLSTYTNGSLDVLVNNA